MLYNTSHAKTNNTKLSTCYVFFPINVGVSAGTLETLPFTHCTLWQHERQMNNRIHICSISLSTDTLNELQTLHCIPVKLRTPTGQICPTKVC